MINDTSNYMYQYSNKLEHGHRYRQFLQLSGIANYIKFALLMICINISELLQCNFVRFPSKEQNTEGY